MATLYRAGGQVELITLPGGPRRTLEVLQAAVEGDIEVLSLRDGTHMVINADGIMLGLARNDIATALAKPDLIAGDWIKGNAVVCAPGEFETADAAEDTE